MKRTLKVIYGRPAARAEGQGIHSSYYRPETGWEWVVGVVRIGFVAAAKAGLWLTVNARWWGPCSRLCEIAGYLGVVPMRPTHACGRFMMCFSCHKQEDASGAV